MSTVKQVKPVVDVFAVVKKAKTLGISQLEKNTESTEVWVLNVAASTHGRNAEVVVGIGSGRSSRSVVVPDTWVPVCLTNQATKQELLSSNKFRAALGGNQHHGVLLRAISDEDAEKILAFSESKKELARMDARRREMREARKEQPRGKKDDGEVATNATKKPKATVSGMVMNLTLGNEQGTIDGDTFLNTLKANTTTLKRVDLEYLANNAEDRRVKKWAAGRLAKHLSVKK